MPPTMTMWPSRLEVDPLALTPADVRVRDVAHHLARLCRYNGAVQDFLSVARHSLAVSHLCTVRGEPRDVCLWGLLHDAAEAYLGDMVAPLKHRPGALYYREWEAAVERAVGDAFGLDAARLAPLVKPYDRYVGACEQTLLRGRPFDGAALPDAGYRESFAVGRALTGDGPYDPRADAAEFLARFLELS